MSTYEKTKNRTCKSSQIQGETTTLNVNTVNHLASHFKTRKRNLLDFTDALEALLKRTETRPWQTTPPFILELLLDNFNINTDYYASPLDHNNRIPSFAPMTSVIGFSGPLF